MSIDAYDTLGINPDADAEQIKKAFRRLSLQYHPDKLMGQPASAVEKANGKFLEIKAAHDILSNEERKKIYDTFGIDLGEERPEMEVWGLGSQHVLAPAGMFTLRTLLMRIVVWLISFTWCGYIVLLLTLIGGLLYATDFTFKEIRMQSEEAKPVIQGLGIAVAVVMVCWWFPLLSEGVGIFFLATEVFDVAMFVENWKLGAGAALLSLFLSWLLGGWWWWIVGLEILLAIIMLIAITVASGLMGIWIENVKQQHGDTLKKQRLKLRGDRKALQAEADDLKRQLEEASSRKAAERRGAVGKK